MPNRVVMIACLAAAAGCDTDEEAPSATAEAELEQNPLLANCEKCEPVAFASGEFPDEPPPTLVTGTDETPAPVSQLETWSREVAAHPLDHLVVRANVTARDAAKERLAAVEAPMIHTTVKLHILETYCGSSLAPVVNAKYRGGVLLTGEALHTTAMPRDLQVGLDYILLLTSFDGTFLIGSSRSVAILADSKTDSTEWTTASAADLSSIREACL